MHARHHFGFDRTLFSMMQRYPELVTRRKDVEKVISACVPCRSVDPAAERWPKGDVSVEEDWTRLACDVTKLRWEEVFDDN